MLGKPWLADAGSACTQSFLFFMFDTKKESESFQSYYATRFFRFLVSLRKTTQHAPRAAYKWVPKQEWNQKWTDNDLYQKYGLTEEEITYIESMVSAMEVE